MKPYVARGVLQQRLFDLVDPPVHPAWLKAEVPMQDLTSQYGVVVMGDDKDASKVGGVDSMESRAFTLSRILMDDQVWFPTPLSPSQVLQRSILFHGKSTWGV